MADDYNISYEDLPPPPLYLLHHNVPQPKEKRNKIQEKKEKIENLLKNKECKYDDPHSFPPPPPPLSQPASQIQNQAMAQSHITVAGNAPTASNPTSVTPKPIPAQSNSKQTNSLKNNSYYSWRDEECKTECPPNCNSGMCLQTLNLAQVEGNRGAASKGHLFQVNQTNKSFVCS